jgi:S-adenosylmethionine decarboxylase
MINVGTWKGKRMAGFIQEGSLCFAGKHLLLDLHDCEYNAPMEQIQQAMIQACLATGATVLFDYAHPFEGNGSSGVIVLAESHGSWHQWPENNFVAIDIFVCGTCDPHLAVPVLVSLFKPKRVNVKLEKRGQS